MLGYVLTSLALYLLAVAAQGDPSVMVAFPAVTGYYFARGQYERGAALAVGLATAGFAATGALGLGLMYGLGAASGVFFARGWRFGKAVAAVSGILCALTLLVIASHPEETLNNASDVLNTLMRKMDEAGAAAAGSTALESLRWLDEHLKYVALGILCGGIVTNVCIFAAILSWRLRRIGVRGKLIGRFRDARTPDWLVWVAIALAAAWFAEQRWPNDMLRMVTWNSAIALTQVYGINGFGVLVCTLKTFQMSGMWYYVPLAMVLFLGNTGTVLLCTVGFFDTWWEFRRRLRAVAAIRRGANNDHRGED